MCYTDKRITLLELAVEWEQTGLVWWNPKDFRQDDLMTLEF